MNYKKNLINNLIDIINKTDKLEQHIFIEYITKNNIYFYQFISIAKENKSVLHKIIDMLNINYDFFIKTINIINSTFKITNHQITYPHEYYLILICQLLNNHNQWISLKLNILANNTNKYHYKSIHKKFILYSNKNIFKNVFYDTTINNKLINDNNNLLINATMISNKLGSENVTVNCEYTKKNCTKISFISNTDKIILSVTPYDVNNKEIDYNEINEIKNQKKKLKKNKQNKIKELKKENTELKLKLKKILKNGLNNENTNKIINEMINKKIKEPLNDMIYNIDNNIKNEDNDLQNEDNDLKNEDNNLQNDVNNKKLTIKTSIHDVMMIQTSINNIKTQFTNLNDITLTGDLGYLTSKQHILNNKNILLITPKRKNQTTQNTEIESIKLKLRYKIENCFGIIKQYERIILRKEKKIKTFMSFMYIACAIENNKLLKKLSIK
jgi:hypothetical protein